MKRLITLLVTMLVLFSPSICYQSNDNDNDYVVSTLRCIDSEHQDGLVIKLPKGSPDLTDIYYTNYNYISPVLMYFEFMVDNEKYYTIVLRGKCRLLVFSRFNYKNGVEYYIYPEAGCNPVKVESWEDVKYFLCDHDPYWKEVFMKDKEKI